MTRRYRALLAAALAVVLAVATVGCCSDDGDEAGAGGNGKLDKVTYLTAFGAVGRDAFAWVAQEKGYFKEAGFEVDDRARRRHRPEPQGADRRTGPVRLARHDRRHDPGRQGRVHRRRRSPRSTSRRWCRSSASRAAA